MSSVTGCVIDVAAMMRDFCSLKARVAALEAKVENFTSTNKASAPCKCVVKQTEVPSMGIIYAQAECPIHGHLHGAHC